MSCFCCCSSSVSARSHIILQVGGHEIAEFEDTSLVQKVQKAVELNNSDGVIAPFRETVAIDLKDNRKNTNLSLLLTADKKSKFRVIEDDDGNDTLQKVEGCFSRIKYAWSRRTKARRDFQDTKVLGVFNETLTELNAWIKEKQHEDGEIEATLGHTLQFLFSEHLSELPNRFFYRGCIAQGSALEKLLMPEEQELREQLIDLFLDYCSEEEKVDNYLYQIGELLLELGEAEGEFARHLGKELSYIGGSGSGGARKGVDRYGQTIFANKADDETVYRENNPRKRAIIKRFLYKGPKALRGHSDAMGAELSYMQDDYGDLHVVPPTKQYWATSKAFVGKKKRKLCSMQLWVDGAKDFSSILKEVGIKEKSVWFNKRKTLKAHYKAEFEKRDYLKNILPPSLFAWFGLADWEQENRDCHFENGLVKVFEVDKYSTAHRLVVGGDSLKKKEIRHFVEHLFTKKQGASQTNYQLLLQELFRHHEFKCTFTREDPSEEQQLLEALYPHLRVDWDKEEEDEVEKTLRTVFIKIDNDSSFPHAHESSFLGTAKKHLIEVLPPLQAPLEDDEIKDHFDANERENHLSFLESMTAILLRDAVLHAPSFATYIMDPDNREFLKKWITADPSETVTISVSYTNLPRTNRRNAVDRQRVITLVKDKANATGNVYTVPLEFYYRHKVIEGLVPILAKNYGDRAKVIHERQNKELKRIYHMVHMRKESREVLIAHLASEEADLSLGPIFTTKKEDEFAAKLEEARNLDEVREYRKAFSEFPFFDEVDPFLKWLLKEQLDAMIIHELQNLDLSTDGLENHPFNDYFEPRHYKEAIDCLEAEPAPLELFAKGEKGEIDKIKERIAYLKGKIKDNNEEDEYEESSDSEEM